MDDLDRKSSDDLDDLDTSSSLEDVDETSPFSITISTSSRISLHLPSSSSRVVYEPVAVDPAHSPRSPKRLEHPSPLLAGHHVEGAEPSIFDLNEGPSHSEGVSHSHSHAHGRNRSLSVSRSDSRVEIEASSPSNNSYFGKLARVKPTIKLEVLSAKWTKFILAVTYLTIIGTMIFGFFETSSPLSTHKFMLNPDPLRPDIKPLTCYGVNSTECNVTVEFQPVELYFSLSMLLNRSSVVSEEWTPEYIDDAMLDVEPESLDFVNIWSVLWSRLSLPPAPAAAVSQPTFEDSSASSSSPFTSHSRYLRDIASASPFSVSSSPSVSVPFNPLSTPLPALRYQFNTTIRLRGYPLDSLSSSSSSSSDPSSNPGSVVSDDNLLFAESRLVDLVCREGKALCETLWMLQENDYAFAYEQKGIKYDRWHIELDTHNMSLPSIGEVTLSVHYHIAYYRYVSMAVHTLLVCTTLVIAALWARRLWKRTWARCVPEQKWICGLLAALVFYQDPFFIPLMLRQLRIFRDLSGVAFYTAMTFMLIFWLLMMDGIRATKDSLHKPVASSNNDEGIELPFIDGDRSYQYNWSFYLSKLVLGFFILFFSITIFFISNLPIVRTIRQGDSASDDFNFRTMQGTTTLTVVLIALAYVGMAVCFLIWFFWMLRSTCRANVELRKLPYLATRFRQLSFRFFVAQTWLVVLYFLFLLSAQAIRGTPSYMRVGSNERTGYLSITLLLSIYIYLMTFIYLPIIPKSESNFLDHLGEGRSQRLERLLQVFSLHTAKWLCDFAWQAYYNPSIIDPLDPEHAEYLSPESRPEGFMDLSHTGFRTVYTGFVDLDDTYCYVAQSVRPQDRRVVVAFRGTASSKNLKTDMSFSRTPFYLSGEGDGVFVGQVHSGFARAYKHVRPFIVHTIREILEDEEKIEDRGHGSYRSREPLMIYCTGHSLGGAMATLCALELVHEFGDRVQVQMYNFGSPRVGDHMFAYYYGERVPYSFRMVYDRDIITTIPKLFVYKHIGLEIIVDSIGNFIVDPTWVEKVMMDSRSSVRDHLMISYVRGIEATMSQLNISGPEFNGVHVDPNTGLHT